ncbi:bifunctional 4-hydroxy-2-oxoglutarate aldolase/2-dehydro-3-deoxy-phosphogluconate aldolase [Pontiella agarivorans]|uniref:2-dehydro-3-deoxy-phosphogluconate aldolase n=1 Tax=Pontiella agarivorans TaxID=3038953 RepID=A0ABU5MW61_9BACT|nr:bifunctional 4-hydroxy-2-oxoglutarate aldolase/2-dehydro-3-deoxy-phosphogluconate aldolase [Pontiella agarivorans]MDZ8118402.1 bifunctional 4-hydroxy-2-oxoglutarate aldolase/2-dehydro-3-deoxy-phosphogluconate aldolase [Pontiella agarivorans]
MIFPDKMIQRLEKTGIVAGFSIEKTEHAVPLANALLEGGIEAIELTFRTPSALDALKAIADQVPQMLIGVGTILTPEQVQQVKEAGAHFAVSPGMNPRVIRAATEAGVPFAPGISTPSDLEAAIELGCRFVKFFPAEAAGGIPYLRSMGAPYKHLGIQYFPLGGLNSANMVDYLKEPNVPTIGGSWIVKQDLVNAGDWKGITARAAEVIETVQKGLKN